MRGLIAVLLSGISGGAFPLPEKHLKHWQWEHIWAVYSLVAMLILPLGTALFFSPALFSEAFSSSPLVSLSIAGSGLLFGVGSVLFGVSLVRLGMAITNALVSGIIVFLGTIGPVLIGSVHLGRKQLVLLIAGLVLLVASLVLCAAAAINRDKEQSVPGGKAGSYSFGSLAVAICAGCFSAMLNIGFAIGAPLADRATAKGFGPMLATLVIWIPALLGGALLNVGYPLFLIGRKKSWQVFVDGRRPVRSWLLAGLMGLLWYSNIMLYGYGASAMPAGAVYGWALSSAASILTSNALGAFAGEWRGAGRDAKTLMILSTALLIASFGLLAYQPASG